MTERKDCRECGEKFVPTKLQQDWKAAEDTVKTCYTCLSEECEHNTVSVLSMSERRYCVRCGEIQGENREPKPDWYL